MSGSYPPGCTQRSHDRAFSEMGPDPEDELRAEEAYWDSWWDALEEFEEFMPAMIDEEQGQ